VARDLNKLRLPPIDLQKLALDPTLKDLGGKVDLPAVPEGLKELGDVDWRPPSRPAAEPKPTPPVAKPELVALEPEPQREPEPTSPEPAPRKPTRKQAAVQDIARRAFSKGEVPPNIGTARFKRDHVDPMWEVVAPMYGLGGSRPPDWHTVNRAIGREL
jgi:hypothetical protein